ncbi:MAG: response regulator transcription factor [Eggerthellaceae bacterium]|nr:response regulator transcription factor [Eggerthellaceae bacterium]
MALKVLYAEDTVDLNRAVSVVLEHEGLEVTTCYDGIQASEALASQVFDLVILDIMMPGKSGIDVLREMRATGDVTPVILLTAKAEVDDRVDGLMAGADDYLPKPFAMKELVARVHSLARRNTDYGTGNLTFGDVELNAETYELKAHTSVRLSHVEFELLRTFILNRNRALSADFLLGRVWTDDDEADQATVSLYVRYLRSKLEAIDAHVTIAEIDGGYILEEGDEA